MMSKAPILDEDVERLKERVLEILVALGSKWLGFEEIVRELRSSMSFGYGDLREALDGLALASRIERLQRPSDDEEVYRARQPNPEGDLPQRVRLLEAELQHALKRLAEVERLVEDRTGPRSDG